VALQLRKHGIRRVRPLLGGFHEWKRLGLPLVEVTTIEDPVPMVTRPAVANRTA